jgi:hypothetical protein
LFPANVCHVSQIGQTIGNISEKHRETLNVSGFARKHFCFWGSKFFFRNNVSTGGQTGKHLRKHRESQMFPQQCFLAAQGFTIFLPNFLSNFLFFLTFFFIFLQIDVGNLARRHHPQPRRTMMIMAEKSGFQLATVYVFMHLFNTVGRTVGRSDGWSVG